MVLRRILIAVLPAALCATLFAADISGIVTNKTTNKPSAGDAVILLELKQGMQEIASTKTDVQGHYTLHFSGSADPHLVRVNHGNVNYHQPAPPGVSTVNVDVYDSADKLDSVSQSVDVMRIEAENGSMRVIEMFSLTNASQPPRTLMSADTFEMVIPKGAQVTQSLAAGPGGMPVNSAPVPTGKNNRYGFVFPIRPGETRFQVAYTMPYSGEAKIEPQLLRATENFAVSVPKSMRLAPAAGSKLQPKGEDAGMAVYVAQNVKPDANLAFAISGTGTVPLDSNDQSAQGGGAGASGQSRPGGGLGEPVNSPDPLYKYRWWLISAVALVLVAGAAYSMSVPGARNVPAGLQQVLKDELFHLETERLENKISAEEYARAKSALDVLMARSVARKTG